jgi:hypothetical protein
LHLNLNIVLIHIWHPDRYDKWAFDDEP